MVYVFISDCTQIVENSRVGISDTAKLIYSRLPKSIMERIDGTKNENQRLMRIFAYGLLNYALKLTQGDADYAIEWGAQGKPCLTLAGRGSDVKINLSHTEKMCAVAVSDEGDVGVDIECEIPHDKAERLKKRLFSDIKICAENKISHIEYHLFEYSEQGEICEARGSEKYLLEGVAEDDYTALWTMGEAMMKCDGRGFLAVGNLADLSNKMNVDTTCISLKNKRYTVSVATYKKQ